MYASHTVRKQDNGQDRKELSHLYPITRIQDY